MTASARLPLARLRFPLLAGAAVALLVGAAWRVSGIWSPTPPRTLLFATGPEGSAYAAFGARYREILARVGVEVRLQATAGALDNLRRLRDPGSGVSVGFVQRRIFQLYGELKLIELEVEALPVGEGTEGLCPRLLPLALVAVAAVVGASPPRGTAAEPPIRLIVRGDDMGSSQASNEAVLRCFENGVMRDVELMAVGPWFPEAARLLRESPGLDVGLHLALTSEWDNVKWRPLTTAPSLVERAGFFFPMIWPGPNYGRDRALKERPWKLDEIERELRAQIEVTKREVPQLSHLSDHMGFQALGPEVAALVKRLAVEYGLDIDPEVLGVRPVGWYGEPQAPADKVVSFTRLVEGLGPGTWLFVDHPALDTPEMRATGHVGYETVAIDRQGVTDAWTSPAVRDVVARRGIELIGYKDLVRK